MESGVARMAMDYFFMSKEETEAHENPLLVMVYAQTGDKYARMTEAKGLGENQERDWLIKDMSEELKDWGHTGGEGGHIILKCDGERPIKKVRDRLARYHGGRWSQKVLLRGKVNQMGRWSRQDNW